MFASSLPVKLRWKSISLEPFNMHTLRVRYVPNMVGYVPSDRGLGTVQTGAFQSVTLPPEEDIAMRKAVAAQVCWRNGAIV